MSLLQLLLKGGWVMIPILILSILAVYGLVERLLTLQRQATPADTWVEGMYQKIKAGDLTGALAACEQKKHTALAQVLQAGLSKLPHEPQHLERTMEAVGQDVIHRLEKNLSLLGSIASIAPMLGFLGTVWGMIQAFMAMSQINAPITPQVLASGIYQAMITTAAGLIVGIVADVSYKYVLTRVEHIAYQLQQVASKLIDCLPAVYKLHLPTAQAHEA